MKKLKKEEIRKLETGQTVTRRFENVTIPDCPICRSYKSVRTVKTIIKGRSTNNYFCSDCLIEFNIKVEIYPYEKDFIQEKIEAINF